MSKTKSHLSRLLSLLLLSSGLVAMSAAPATATYVPNETLKTVINFDSATDADFTGFGNAFAQVQTSVSPSVSAVSSVSAGAPASGKFVVVNRYWDTWGGTNLPTLSGDEFISSLDKVVKIRIFTPASGMTVKLQLGEATVNNATNVEVDITSQGGWEVATFDFTSLSSGTYTESVDYERATIFFNFGVGEYAGFGPGAANSWAGGPFYLDDVTYTTTAKTVINYDSATDGDFTGFGNAYAQVQTISSPSVSAVSSVSAGAPSTGKFVVVNRYYETWGGTNLPTLSGDEFISAQDKVVKIRIFTPASGMTVKLQLGEATVNNATNVEVNLTSQGGWEVATFNFNSLSAGTYNDSIDYARATIFFNFGVGEYAGFGPGAANGWAGGPFYLDDVTYTSTAGGGAPQFQLVTTMSQAVQYDFETKPAGWETFAGASADLTATPAGANAPTGTNSGYITESDVVGVETYAGLTVDVRTSNELISATSKIVQLRVKAPTSTTSVTMKLEAPGNDPNGGTPELYVQKSATAGTTSWNVLTFDFSSPSAGTYTEGSNYVKVVLFFNLGTKDPITQTLYFDDLAFTPNAVTLGASSTPRSGENKGNYPHIRLDKGFLDTNLDATWWDGVWQYRDADTRAYLKYIPVRSTFQLTYTVTDADDKPMADALVTLIVNANYSCAKTFFMYENSLIGPDDCAGNGETQLPAKRTDANGKVSFVLTNTNAEGEKMPLDLNGPPNGKELGTNIKPHLVGAKQEGIDMLFAHFVEQSDAAKIVAPATETAKTGTPHVANFEFLDEAGKPMANQLAEVYINGPDSKQSWVLTDSKGRVGIPVPNSNNLEGTSAVAVSVKRTGKLPLTATTMVNWVPGLLKVSMAPSSNSVEVKVVNATNKSVKIVINGKSYDRTPTTGLVTYKFPATLGKKVIRVTIGKKTFVKSVTVKK